MTAVFNDHPEFAKTTKHKAAMLSVLNKFGVKPNYFASLKSEDWVKPEYIAIEKSKKLYAVLDEGDGNVIFFSETDGDFWCFDHEMCKVYKFDFKRLYTLHNEFEGFAEYVREHNWKEDYASPYRIKSQSKPKATMPFKDKAQIVLGGGIVGAGIGSMAGPVGTAVGGVIGAAGSAALVYNESYSAEELSILLNL